MITSVPESRLLALLISRQAALDAIDQTSAEESARRQAALAPWLTCRTDTDRAALADFDQHVAEVRESIGL